MFSLNAWLASLGLKAFLARLQNDHGFRLTVVHKHFSAPSLATCVDTRFRLKVFC